ncbi:MAG: hypothetical protein GC136_01735 [Alphaproteobacteria bacterium]|nr:hypothetical protein [Alphaproteobacteria bacterium]
MDFINNVFAPIVVGTASFFVLNLILNPVMIFYRLRKRIHIDLIDFANIWAVKSEYDQERAYKASVGIRRLSAELRAIEYDIQIPCYFMARLILYRFCKFNLNGGADSLMRYHNHMMEKAGRDAAEKEIRGALGLPVV